MLAYVERTWSQWLGNLMPELPTCDKVIGQLRPEVAAIVQNSRAAAEVS